MRKILALTPAVAVLLLFSSCCRKHAEQGTSNLPSKTGKAGPPVYIYKTKADYSKHVPVILSPDKQRVVSYPDVKDVYYQGELAYPVPLHDGFLLDRRGISPDAAFLTYTYEEYIQMTSVPSPETMMEYILDKDPFTALYYCGTRFQYKDLVTELNEKIDKKDFSGFEKRK
ncbi:MAG TPA: hypothetical protein P5531_10760 [Bacteroidales bacterium]|nr:hypothetical protein [Bacteroidales bacterium]HSA44042.1 hypothetical protein [Bacteroidales bacterium]